MRFSQIAQESTELMGTTTFGVVTCLSLCKKHEKRFGPPPLYQPDKNSWLHPSLSMLLAHSEYGLCSDPEVYFSYLLTY